MSYAGSGGDDQSEDGELRHSPDAAKTKQEDVLDFSLSEEDVDTADSLDIKPPQAATRLPHTITSSSTSSRNKRRGDRIRDARSRHGSRSERHREQERGHSHRDKHYREQRSGRERSKEHFRERGEMYREKEVVYMSEKGYYNREQQRYGGDNYLETHYRRDEMNAATSASTSREVRYVEARKYDEKRMKDERYGDKEIRDVRYAQDPDRKSRRYDPHSSRLKSAADQTLDDLRERLLDKKRLKETTSSGEDYKHVVTAHDASSSSRRRVTTAAAASRTQEITSSVATLEADAEMYVKEIIDLSTAAGGEEAAVGSGRKERYVRKEEEEEEEEETMEWEDNVVVVEKKITDAEREEQEMRKEKLLEAEREIARQKEQYKLERERRHQRRLERQEAKRRLQEQEHLETLQRKRAKMSDALGQYKDKDISIVTVSDNTSNSSDNDSPQVNQLTRSDTDSGSVSQRDDDDDDDEEEEGERSDNSDDDADADDNTDDANDASERSGAVRRVVRRHRNSDDDDDDDDDDDERGESDASEQRRERKSDEERSTSRSRSRSASPKPNGQLPGGANLTDAAKQSKSTEAGGGDQQQLQPPPQTKQLDAALPPYFPAIQGCRSVEEFQCLNRIEEGTYGVVYRARDKRTEEIVALKRLKMEKEKEGFPITSLREINTLLKGQHPNIVTVREIVVGSNMDKIFIVMDYVEHDLKSLMETMRNRRQVFVPAEVKCLLRQLLGAVAHLHDNWILHRDLKTSNLLLSHKGILKVGDFGLAREYGSPLKAYTPIVVTLWYRAPELLLCCKEYSTPVDMWSVGCIFAELLLMNALFPGKSEVDQLNRIFKDLGTPNERIWPGYNELPAVKKMKFTEYPVSQLRSRFSMLTDTGLGLLQRFLTYDPVQRVTAEDALKHPYFNEAPLPIDPAMFPTWPAKSELGHRKAMAASPKPPSGGREYKQLGDGDEDSALGFHMGGTSTTTSLLEQRRLAMGGGFSLKF